MKFKSFTLVFTIAAALLFGSLSAQNVGINTNNPSEPLEVGGIIYSSADGFKFPDGSVQNRAMTSFPASDNSEERGIIVMQLDTILGPFNFGNFNDVVKVLDLSWGSNRHVDLEPLGQPDLPDFDDFTILKERDKTTVPLIRLYFEGELIPVIDFYMLREDTNTYQWEPYYHIQLTGAYVSHIGQFTEYSGGDRYRHLERITFVFTEIYFEYQWNGYDDYFWDVVDGVGY